ncbi:MAG: hypothetical protein JWP94_1673 [Mucilaginibacter sp.]|nr:hypothetical protein [Mucilaginibacter sp.]
MLVQYDHSILFYIGGVFAGVRVRSRHVHGVFAGVRGRSRQFAMFVLTKSEHYKKGCIIKHILQNRITGFLYRVYILFYEKYKNSR